MKIRSGHLIKALAVYSFCVITAISFLILSSDEADIHQKAIIKMALGLVLFWIVIGGTLMYLFREPLSRTVQNIPLNWKIKFVLFAIALALLEEAVTVSMTNLAPFFGSKIGEAFITASANYLHTVLFHSVIVFIPMFITWSFLLGRYGFNPNQVFLLFGLVGSLAEMSMQPSNIFGGFWFFVYGLMVFLPACSIPPADVRGARTPRFRHYVLAVVLPLVSPIILLPAAPLLKYLYNLMDPVFFVDSPFA
ncbi:MAG: hypothetical protein ACYTFW_08705 [Planctomycetota bacterium]